MSDMQKQIDEFIEATESMKPEVKVIFADIVVWLKHQNSIISQQAEEIETLKLALKASHKTGIALSEEVERLRRIINDHENGEAMRPKFRMDAQGNLTRIEVTE